MTRYLSPSEIASALGISRAHAYRLIASLPRVHIGRCVRVAEQDLDAYLKRRKEKPWDASISDEPAESIGESSTPQRESEPDKASRPATKSSPESGSAMPSWARPLKRAAGVKG